MSKRFLSVFYVLLAGCLWGCMGLLVRPVSRVLPGSIDLVFLRSLISSVSLGVGLLLFNRKAFLIKLKDIWCFIGTGILSITFFNYCYFSAIKRMDLGVAAVLLYTSPAFVIVLSYFLFKERITKTKIIALAFAIMGCTLVSGIINSGVAINTVGIMYGLGAGFGYALYSIFSRYAILRGYSSFTITFYTFLFSTIATSFMTDVRKIPAAFSGEGKLFIYAFIMVIAITLLPYIIYTLGLEGMDNGRASVISAIEPVMATVVGIIAYGEKPDLFCVIGMGLVLFSIFLLNTKEETK